MKSFFIDESKYPLESRLIKANTSVNIRHLLERFNNGIAQLANSLNMPLFARTHVEGLTYFVTERKGLIFLNIRWDYLTLKFYTGRSSIGGLQKRNWIAGGDNTGSESFRVTDDPTLRKALGFARQSVRITSNEL
ncbi:MAG: hypothetical protein HZA08_04665 [Nitrospirae bacterium]|nr:hypothetical protein [Nitrospirota bacterium]